MLTSITHLLSKQKNNEIQIKYFITMVAIGPLFLIKRSIATLAANLYQLKRRMKRLVQRCKNKCLNIN